MQSRQRIPREQVRKSLRNFVYDRLTRNRMNAGVELQQGSRTPCPVSLDKRSTYAPAYRHTPRPGKTSVDNHVNATDGYAPPKKTQPKPEKQSQKLQKQINWKTKKNQRRLTQHPVDPPILCCRENPTTCCYYTDESGEEVKEYMWSCGFTIRKRRTPSHKRKHRSQSCRITNRGGCTHTVKPQRPASVSEFIGQHRCDQSVTFNERNVQGFYTNTANKVNKNNRDTIDKTRKVVLYQPSSRNSKCSKPPDTSPYKLYHFDSSFHELQSDEDDDSEMRNKSGKKPIRIHLIENDSLLLVFEAKSLVQELFDQVCNLLSIKDTRFFGLSTIVENEQRFMDPKHKLCKYADKEWNPSSDNIKGHNPAHPAYLVVQFQVQYYVEHPRLISDKTTRTQYYLQMKKNVLLTKIATQDETLFALAAYGLQCDLGPFNKDTHTGKYFKPTDYFPLWYLERWGLDYLYTNLPHLHAEMKRMNTFEAQAEYIKRASNIDDVPVHYYKLFKTKREVCPSVVIGIFHRGIRIHHGAMDKSKGKWKLEFEFMWNKVSRLFFAGRKFEIYPEDAPEDRKLIYFTGSHSRSKYLLRLLSGTHSLYMSLSPHAQHLKRVDGKLDFENYRESYVNEEDAVKPNQKSDIQNEVQTTQKSFMSHYTSTTSHGSSRTSGIESDSKQLTEKEDDEEFDVGTDSNSDLGYVNVTERELSSMPSKSISVQNLIDDDQDHAIDLTPTTTEEKHTSIVSVIDKTNERTPTVGTPVAFTEDQIADDTNLVELIKTDSQPEFDHPEPPKQQVIPRHLLDHTTYNNTPMFYQEKPNNASQRSQPVSSISATNSLLTVKSEGTGRRDKSKITWLAPKAGAATQMFYDDTHTVPRKCNSTSAVNTKGRDKKYSGTLPLDNSNSKTSKSRHRANTTSSPTKPTKRTNHVQRSISGGNAVSQNPGLSNSNHKTQQPIVPVGVHTLNKTTLSRRPKSSSVQQKHKENQPKKRRPHSHYITTNSLADAFKPLTASTNIMKSLEDLSKVSSTNDVNSEPKKLPRLKKQVSKNDMDSSKKLPKPSTPQKSNVKKSSHRNGEKFYHRSGRSKSSDRNISEHNNLYGTATTAPKQSTYFHNISYNDGVLV